MSCLLRRFSYANLSKMSLDHLRSSVPLDDCADKDGIS